MVDASALKDRVRVGTSGWSFPDWTGIVYPPDRQRGFSELAFLARFLDAVEINTSFYRPPLATYCRKWLRDVRDNERFAFTAKLWRRFTHEREHGLGDADVRTFKDALAPLADAGRLGAVLVQFPWAFARTPANEDWLWRVTDAFAEWPLATEVRHVSWLNDDTLAGLKARGIAFCNIDQPASRQSVGATNIVGGGIAYYRLHGRNSAKWFDRNAGRDERYDYLYDESELAPWLDRIAEVADQVEQIYVMANNHYKGQAFTNALQIKAGVSGEKVLAPESLVKHYPILRASTRAAKSGPASLFDQ